jgi:hypothetical protein
MAGTQLAARPDTPETNEAELVEEIAAPRPTLWTRSITITLIFGVTICGVVDGSQWAIVYAAVGLLFVQSEARNALVQKQIGRYGRFGTWCLFLSVWAAGNLVTSAIGYAIGWVVAASLMLTLAA